MMSHMFFVAASYGITGLTLVVMIAWVLIDQRARLGELAELEARGVRRRSDTVSGRNDAPGERK